MGSSITLSYVPFVGSRIQLNNRVAGSLIRNGVSGSSCSASASASAAPAPWLMLPPSIKTESRNMVYKFYSLGEGEVIRVKNKRSSFYGEDETIVPVKYVGSSHGWLAVCKPFRDEQFLYNPLTGRRVDLPPIHSLPGGDYSTEINKLILSCSPDDEENCMAIMSYTSNQRLAVCFPSHYGCFKWTPIGKPAIQLDVKTFPRRYSDFVYSGDHNLFICVTRFGEFEAWNIPHHDSNKCPPEMTPIHLKADKKNHPWGSVGKSDENLLKKMFASVKCLVVSEQTNQLFLVRRHVANRKNPFDLDTIPLIKTFPYKTVSFDVYEIDLDKRELRYMENSLNGLTMFVGLNNGFAISGNGGGVNPDSIYFTDAKEYSPFYLDNESTYGGHDIGVFDYVNRDFSPCYYPTEKRTFSTTLTLPPAASGVDKIKRIVPPPMWFTPSF
ncbi:hypothetical protein ACP275_08G049600 [Erythranthe tilingii]